MGYVNKTYLSTQFKNFADKIAKVFSKIGHTHLKSDITDFPTSMPANGGNAATVGGHTVGVNVPSNAKFTDTWRPVVDNLTSTATDSSLSANQGKVLDDKINSLSNYYKRSSYTVKITAANQTIVSIPNEANYKNDIDVLTVYLNGVHCVENIDYSRTTTGVTFTNGLTIGTIVEFDIFRSVVGNTKLQIDVDNTLSTTSTNPVQNKVLATSLSNIKLNISASSEYIDHVIDNSSYINNKTVYLKLQIQLKKAIPANAVVTVTLSGAPTSQTMGTCTMVAAAYSIPAYISGNTLLILNNSGNSWGGSGWTPNIIGTYLMSGDISIEGGLDNKTFYTKNEIDNILKENHRYLEYKRNADVTYHLQLDDNEDVNLYKGKDETWNNIGNALIYNPSLNFSANSSNLQGIVPTEYVDTFQINTFKLGNKVLVGMGRISFAKVGTNVDLLTNLPFQTLYSNTIPTSTWIGTNNPGPAFLYVNGSTISGAFPQAGLKIDYVFNFIILIQ